LRRLAIAMVLDHFQVEPNPARDRRIKLPLEEHVEPSPPTAGHVEACARLLTPEYRLAVNVLDATGARLGELARATVGDLDEERQAWLVRSAVSKTRQARLVGLPDGLWRAVLDRLPPREDRHDAMALLPGVTADRLRTAIARACRAAGVPVFSPHDLRHRRISLLHKQGFSWAEVGTLVGQKSRIVTADTYAHVLLDYREVDRIL
jgi:integrase